MNIYLFDSSLFYIENLKTNLITNEKMQIVLFHLLILSSLNCLAYSQFTKLQWTDCGSPNVQFFDMAVKPMPIVYPGPIWLSFNAELLRDIRGKVKTDLNIMRTVGGVTLPIKWYSHINFFGKH